MYHRRECWGHGSLTLFYDNLLLHLNGVSLLPSVIFPLDIEKEISQLLLPALLKFFLGPGSSAMIETGVT